MAERNRSKINSGENPETVIEMVPAQQSQNRESDLEVEGDQLARALGDIGTTDCLLGAFCVLSILGLVLHNVWLILLYTGIVDICHCNKM